MGFHIKIEERLIYVVYFWLIGCQVNRGRMEIFCPLCQKTSKFLHCVGSPLNWISSQFSQFDIQNSKISSLGIII